MTTALVIIGIINIIVGFYINNGVMFGIGIGLIIGAKMGKIK